MCAAPTGVEPSTRPSESRRRPGPAAARPGAGTGRDEPDLARRRGLVPRADVRRPSQLPGRHPGAARPRCSSRRQLQPGHLRPERRRHLRRAPPHRLDRVADRVRRDRRRRLHQRRHPVQPPGPAARARPARSRSTATRQLRILASTDSHFSVQKAARLLGLGDAVVVRCRSTNAGWTSADAEPRPRRRSATTTWSRWPSWPRRAPPTSARSTRCPRLPACAGSYGAWLHVDAAYGGGLLVSPTRRHLLDGHRARRLGDRRLPQDLVPAGLRQRSRRARPRHLRPRHLARRLPQPETDRSSASQPGRQEPADHPPVRRAQAVADPADHGSRPDRRVRRRRRST